MKILALLIIGLLMVSPPANAQGAVEQPISDGTSPVSGPEVQTLKGQLEGFLENQKSMALKNGCKLDAKGNVTVEKAYDQSGGAYYAFTLPHITYTDAKGVKSEIGMIALNAVQDGEFNWKVSFSLPTPISSFSAGGTEMVRTDIGNQMTSGVWNTKLGHFVSLTSTFDNIRVNNLQDQGTVTVGSLTLNSQLTERDPEAYTGTANATLSNISFFDAGTQFKGSLPKIELTTNLADRAYRTPMTKEQVRTRPQSSHPDFYNIFSMMFGAPERVQATVTGLDAVGTQLQQSMITAKPDIRAKFLQALLGVSAVNGMGKPLPADPASKYYDVVFNQTGSVMINGTDFGALVNTTTAPASGTPKR